MRLIGLAQDINAMLARYQAEIEAISRTGPVDYGCVFSDVNGQGRPFWRYQAPSGKRRYVRKSELASLRAACSRGRDIRALESKCIAEIQAISTLCRQVSAY